MKDLVDIVLLANGVSIQASDLRAVISATFAERGTHLAPDSLPMPPAGWITRFRELAAEVGIDPDVEVEWRAASEFLNPVLGGEVEPQAVWSPSEQRWVVG